MTRAGRPIGEDDLQAFVDGRLPPDRAHAVEAFLAESPEIATRLAAYRGQRELLKERLRFKADEPIPARLRIAAVAAERRGVARRRLRVACAASLWLVLGGALGWVANDLAGPDPVVPGAAARWSGLTREALAAHRVFTAEVAHPVEVRAEQDAHLAQWIAKRLGRRLAIPDLTAVGFRLMGGRILPAGPDTAAQLMYDDAHGTRLTLYVRVGDSGESGLRSVRRDDLTAFYWTDDGCGYVVSAPLASDRLRPVAESAFRQFEGDGPGKAEAPT